MKKYINKIFRLAIPLGIQRRNCLIVFSFLLGIAQLQAQPVCYGYDGSGNRIVRQSCPQPPVCQCPAGNPMQYQIGEDDEETLLTETDMYKQNMGSMSGVCITVAGKLIIDVPYGFYGTSLMMQPGAEIVVNNPSATLSFYGATLRACYKLWRGINVGPSCTLNMYGNSRIEDAFYAIKLGDQSKGTLENCTFDKNHIGIFVDGSNSSSIITTSVIIKGNTFDCTGGVLNKWDNSTVDYYTKAGIEGNNAVFQVGVNLDASSKNTFNQMLCGILATNCNATLYYVDIKNTQQINYNSYNVNPVLSRNDAEKLGVGAWNSILYLFDSEINGVNRGVHLQSMKGFSMENTKVTSSLGGVLLNEQNTGFFYILNCEIKAPLTGLRLKDVTFTAVQIQNNKFFGQLKEYIGSYQNTQGYVIDINNITPDPFNSKRLRENEILYTTDFHGISLLNNGAYVLHKNILKHQNGAATLKNMEANGITLSNSSNNKIVENNVTVVFNQSVYPANYSLNAIFASSSSDNNYCCNITDKTKNGFCFLGTNGNSKMKTNEMRTHLNNGLYISSGSFIGVQTNHWNKWKGLSGKNATNDNTGTTLSSSIFEIADQQSPGSEWFPNVISPATGWFNSLLSSTAYGVCEILGDCSPSIKSSDGTTIPLMPPTLSYITHQYDDAPFGKFTTWNGSRWVLKKIESNPDWLQNTTINTFKVNNQNSNIKRLNQIDVLLSQINAPNAVQETSINEIYATIEANKNRLSKLGELLNNDPSETDSISYAEERYSLLVEQANMMDRINNIQNEIHIAKYSKIESAKSINGLLVPQNEFERNEKTINSIYLNTIAKGDTLTDADKASITQIAGLCPMIGGTAVFKARFLYGYFAVPSFNDEAICFPSGGAIGGKIAKNTTSGPEVRIYPNPVNDELFVNTTSTEPVTMILFDITGKIVMQQDFTASTQISTSDLLSGLYFCEIWKGKEKLFTQKLSVVH